MPWRPDCGVEYLGAPSYLEHWEHYRVRLAAASGIVHPSEELM